MCLLKQTKYLFLFIVLIIFSSCVVNQKMSNPYSHIKDKKVVEILKKSYATLGGLENWQNIQELHYDKQSTLLLESGEVENRSFQYHDYFYNKNEIRISWKATDGSKHKMVSKNGNPIKYIDEQIDTSANTTALKTSFATSLFVISVPFKMMDQGVTLSYEGSDILEDGKKVEVIKGVYNPDKFANHNKPDTWWYYFDNQDFRMVGYLIQHDGRYSYVRNTGYDSAGNFIFPASRESYRVDENRKILFVRAKYTYDNWLVKQ